MKKRERSAIGPSVPVCVHCALRLGPLEPVKHLGFTFCPPCAQDTGLTTGIEKNPAKYGGFRHG